jgi:hypothetical protein
MMDNPTAFGLFSENDAISAQLHCFRGSCDPFFNRMDLYSILQPGERVLSDTAIDDSARLTLRCGLTTIIPMPTHSSNRIQFCFLHFYQALCEYALIPLSALTVFRYRTDFAFHIGRSKNKRFTAGIPDRFS